MGVKKKEASTDLVLYSPDEIDDEEREAPQGLLLPLFFYLSNNTALIALPIEYENDSVLVAFPYKVEMVRDKDGLFTRLRLFYPKTYITLYKSSLIYEAAPIPSAEYRFVNTLLCERKREYQRLLYDLGFDQDSNFEYLKQRKIELESKHIK